MPFLTNHFTTDGPLVEVFINASLPRLAALRNAGQAAPTPAKIRLLVDTGASSTCIDAKVMKQLGIAATGSVPIHTPSTGTVPQSCDLYDVGIVILDPIHSHSIPIVPVIESDFSTQGIDGLLGRDILSKMLLIYDGKAGRFTLSY